MSALSDLLNRHFEKKYGDTSNRRIADKAGVSRGTIDNYRNGTHPARPSDEVLRAFHDLLGIPMEQLREAAHLPPGEDEPYSPPSEANLLNARQRRAIDELIRSFVATQEARNEDQDTQDPQGDPPADGEAGTRRAPMNDRASYRDSLPEWIRYQYDQVTCGILIGLSGSENSADWPDLPVAELHKLVRAEYARRDHGDPYRTITSHRQAYAASEYFDDIRSGKDGFQDLAAAFELPFGQPTLQVVSDPVAQELHAARDIDGPTQGELRRRRGKGAAEENQDPGDDWDGA